MAAVTQIRNHHSEGYSYYQRKIAERQSPKMALRSLKRRITNTLYRAMITDAERRHRVSARPHPRHEP
jgi:transposase